MGVEVKKIIEYCQDYLKVKDFQDSSVNGLQVEGAPKTGRIVTGVSISEELIRSAVKKRAKLLIAHHGIFKSEMPMPEIRGYLRKRLKLLLENNINFAAFHLPLDAHPVIGNNASLLKALGLKKSEVIDSPAHGPIGFVGEYKEAVKFEDFFNLVGDKLQTRPVAIPAGPSKVRRVGIISGGASPDFVRAAEMGADTYLTGDIRESTVRAVEETGINFINAGHYNTEKPGIYNLGELIAKKFGIKAEFVDIPNDV